MIQVCSIMFLCMLLIYSDVSAEVGPEGEPPIMPFEYTCDAYKNDMKIDSEEANKKAYKTIEISLNALSDGIAYGLYQQFVRDKKILRPLADTLKFHRKFELKTEFVKKLIAGTVEEKGATEFILLFCNHKDASVNGIAYAYSKSYDEMVKSVVKSGVITKDN